VEKQSKPATSSGRTHRESINRLRLADKLLELGTQAGNKLDVDEPLLVMPKLPPAPQPTRLKR
jgi:hypothetical protein